jgi:hypothetical protein
VDRSLHGGEVVGFTAKRKEQSNEAASPTSNAADSGPCTCGFCDGVTVENGYDPRTGEVDSFERMSRRPRCPVCGGENVQYRRSYTAHAAEVAREKGRTRHAYFVTLVLDRETADRAGIGGEDSYKVLAGQRGVWTRSRRAIKRRDGEAQYLGTLSARPSDGRWHAHVLLLTSLSRHELTEALHVTGADAYLSSPDGESHEQFGARKGAYAFDNAANSPSSRFISSRGDGVGYDSKAAVERRRDAVEVDSDSGDSGGGTRARSPRRNQQRDGAGSGEENGAEAAENSPDDDDSSGESGDRAPPVECEGRTFGSLDAYLRAVKRILAGRVGSAVRVHGMGSCTLLKVTHDDSGEGLACTVDPLDVDTRETVVVSWSEIAARNVPKVRRTSNRSPRPDMGDTADTDTSDGTGDGDPVQRFYDEARYSTVTTELPDGRRRVTVKDHETGRMTEHIKPPRQSQSR